MCPPPPSPPQLRGLVYVICTYIYSYFASVYCHTDLVLFQMYYACRVHIYVTYMERFGQTKSEKFNQIYCQNKNCSQRITTRTYVRSTRIYTIVLVEVEICNKPQRLLSAHMCIYTHGIRAKEFSGKFSSLQTIQPVTFNNKLMHIPNILYKRCVYVYAMH